MGLRVTLDLEVEKEGNYVKKVKKNFYTFFIPHTELIILISGIYNIKYTKTGYKKPLKVTLKNVILNF